MFRVFSFLIVVSTLLVPCGVSSEGVPTEALTSTAETTSGRTKVLCICGLSGGVEGHKGFVETLTKIHTVFTTKLGCTASDLTMLFGDEPQTDDPEFIQSSVRSTREELEKRVQQLRSDLKADDRLWVIVVGHSHYDGRQSWLNLPGPDIHQTDFAKLFSGLPAKQQIFVLTTPTSGFYVRPLSSANRIIITATEADWETNETEFASAFASVLSSPPPIGELDVDSDGTVTLLDVYLTVARQLAQSYRDRELLATEHSLLDDNGDGRGSEVQIDYLKPELGGRANPTKPNVPMISPKSDGAIAKTILMPIIQ